MRQLLLAVVFVVCAGCSRSNRTDGQGEDVNLDPKYWKPTKEAIESAKRESNPPPVVVSTTQRGAGNYEQAPTEDPELGEIEKLAPPPMPKLASGDEADQFGLPEWERMARGELHVKRIRY